MVCLSSRRENDNIMKCKVQRVSKNLRYRILTIEGEDYILDMGRSFWKMVFPFFFWIFPNFVYKVNDADIAEQLKAPKVKQKVNYSAVLFGGGVSLLVANLLRPVEDFFNIPSSPYMNIMIVVIVVILVVLFRYFISNINKKNLNEVVELDNLSTDRLWIRPKSFGNFLQVLIDFLLFFGLAVLAFALFIEIGNVIALLCATAFLVVSLVFSGLTVIEGKTTVKFKSAKSKG